VDHVHSALCHATDSDQDDWFGVYDSNLASPLIVTFSCLLRRERNTVIQMSFESWMDLSRYSFPDFVAFIVNVWAEVLMTGSSGCDQMLIQKLYSVTENDMARAIATKGLTNFFLLHGRESPDVIPFCRYLLGMSGIEKTRRICLMKLLISLNLPLEIMIEGLNDVLLEFSQNGIGNCEKLVNLLLGMCAKCSKIGELVEFVPRIVNTIIVWLKSGFVTANYVSDMRERLFGADWMIPIQNALAEVQK
jgi:hypothetical protein